MHRVHASLVLACLIAGTFRPLGANPRSTALHDRFKHASAGGTSDKTFPPLNLREEWQMYYDHLCSLHMGQQGLCSLLGPAMLDHNYTLTPTQLRRSLTHLGANHRLRRVIRDMIVGSGELNVGVIGTSVSWGTGASKRGQTDWFSGVGKTLHEVFKRAKIQMHNGCFPGTPSSFANMCHTKMVKPDVDLLFIEYVTNDFALPNMFDNVKMQAYERLLRKVLNRKNHPAIVLVQVLTWGQSFPANDTNFKKYFHESAEDQYGSMAQYYGLPWLSYRNAVWIDAEYSSPWFPEGWPQLTKDGVHPNDLGHRVILDMVVWLVLQTAMDLLLMPFSKMDAWYIRQGLPAPMHKGNYEESREMCLMDKELQTVVREDLSAGWTFVNEGTAEKPKTGYVSNTPDSKLVIELQVSDVVGDIRRHNETGIPLNEEDAQVAVMISHLHGYTGMGIANISCDSGCNCSTVVVDAYREQRTTVTYMQLIEVATASLDICTMSVTILEGSTCPDGGHKFKVSAVMMNRVTAMGFHWPEEPAEFVADDVFSGEFGKEA